MSDARSKTETRREFCTAAIRSAALGGVALLSADLLRRGAEAGAVLPAKRSLRTMRRPEGLPAAAGRPGEDGLGRAGWFGRSIRTSASPATAARPIACWTSRP